MRFIIAIGVLLPSVIACTAQMPENSNTNTSALATTDPGPFDGSIAAIEARRGVMRGASQQSADTANDRLDGSIAAIEARRGVMRGSERTNVATDTTEAFDGSIAAIEARRGVRRTER
jgi:hypothetical protein